MACVWANVHKALWENGIDYFIYTTYTIEYSVCPKIKWHNLIQLHTWFCLMCLIFHIQIGVYLFVVMLVFRLFFFCHYCSFFQYNVLTFDSLFATRRSIYSNDNVLTSLFQPARLSSFFPALTFACFMDVIRIYFLCFFFSHWLLVLSRFLNPFFQKSWFANLMKYLVSYCMYVFYNQSIYSSVVVFFHQMRQVSVFQKLYTYQRYFTRPVHREYGFLQRFSLFFPQKKSIPALALDTLWFNFRTVLKMNFKTEHLSWNSQQSQHDIFQIRYFTVNVDIVLVGKYHFHFIVEFRNSIFQLMRKFNAPKLTGLKPLNAFYGRQKLNKMRIIKWISKNSEKVTKKYHEFPFQFAMYA